MQIKRTFKSKSLKYGTSEICDEETVRIVARQTAMGVHGKGECSRDLCTHCAEPAMKKLSAGVAIESFFSRFEIVQ